MNRNEKKQTIRKTKTSIPTICFNVQDEGFSIDKHCNKMWEKREKSKLPEMVKIYLPNSIKLYSLGQRVKWFFAFVNYSDMPTNDSYSLMRQEFYKKVHKTISEGVIPAGDNNCYSVERIEW